MNPLPIVWMFGLAVLQFCDQTVAFADHLSEPDEIGANQFQHGNGVANWPVPGQPVASPMYYRGKRLWFFQRLARLAKHSGGGAWKLLTLMKRELSNETVLRVERVPRGRLLIRVD